MISKPGTGLRHKLQSPWFIISFFTLLGLVTISQHAMWRDEFNPWLIVRDSSSWQDLWQSVRYEGHPLLWYLCLSLLHSLTHSVMSMQLFHLAIGVGSVILLWRYSPFRPIEKILITFGYFPVFEYLIISRNYSLGLFFAFLFCAICPSRKRRYWPLAIVLGLMANSHAYALFIAIFLGLMLAVEWICDRHHRQAYLAQTGYWDLIVSVVLILALYGFAAYMISPPSDSHLQGGNSVFLSFDLHRLLVAIGRISSAYLFITPNPKRWLDLILVDTLVLGIVTLVCLKLSRKPLVLLFYGLSTIVLTLVFFYFKSLPSPRHFGSLYVVLLTSLWLGGDYPDSPQLTQRLRIPPNLIVTANHIFKRVFVVMLAFHCVMGLYMVGSEFFLPYSASRATTQYMQTTGLQNEFIIGSRDAQMAPISGYLQRRLYYPELRGYGSFTLFREARTSVTQPEVLDQAVTLLSGTHPTIQTVPAKIVLVLNKPLDADLLNADAAALSIDPIAQFERSYSREQYYLYWLTLR